MTDKEYKRQKSLSTKGHDAFIADLNAEAAASNGTHPATSAKLLAGFYDRL